MKKTFIFFLLTIIMSMVGGKTLAYDIAVVNADGVTQKRIIFSVPLLRHVINTNDITFRDQLIQ